MTAEIALALKLLGVGLELCILLGLTHILRGRYQFPQWQYTWSFLVLAEGGMVAKRLWDFWADIPLGSVVLSCGISLAMLVWLYRLTVIYDLPLTLRNPTIPARIVIDGFSTIIAWDREAERLFGWLSQDAVGKTLMQTIMPPQMWEAHRTGMAQALAMEMPVPIERTFPGLTALRKDGSSIPIEIAVSGRYTEARGWEFHAEIRRLIRL